MSQTTRPTAALVAASLIAFASLPVQAQNLFVNGSFETPNVSYQQLGPGSTVITGWTTVLSGVEHFNAGAGAADGQMVVDLANFTFNAGGLQQAVATVPGQLYAVSFFAGNVLTAGRDGTGIVKASIDGGAPLSFATPVATTATNVWALRSFSFTATGSSTLVRFFNDQNANLHFAYIDGVGVQAAVPEPASVALWLGGLLALGAAAKRRRA